ncbi:MAG: hypothetical protein LBL86_02705 [Coriobacteriales bacterium]|jgi:DNA-binding SARP family transcriptional activator|nr:hypothetical protein [Coriobacteriales bacterium]
METGTMTVAAWRRPALLPTQGHQLIERMRLSHGVPFFISAPARTGRSSLAAGYAQRQHRPDEVLWVDAGTEAFHDALSAGTAFEHLQRQWASAPSRLGLVVFDDMPALNEQACARFSDWIDRMIEEGTEVLVVTTPQEDCFPEFQSDRLLIDGRRLVMSQKWSAERLTDALACFLDGSLPQELRSLAALMILMGRGIPDDLRGLGYLVPPASPLLLRRHCPFVEVDEATAVFDATGIPLAPLEGRLLALLGEAPRNGREEEREEGMSGLERRFERLTQLSLYLFGHERREQGQVLLELAGSLLTHDDAGYPLAGRPPVPLGMGSVGVALPVPAAAVPSAGGEGAAEGWGHVAKLGTGAVRPDGGGAAEGWGQGPQAAGGTQSEGASCEPVAVRLLGDFEVYKGGRRVEGKDMQRSKVRELLAHLALNIGRGVSRDTLIERMWPEKDYARARENFHATWSRLKRLLSGEARRSPYLTNIRGLCKLESSTVSTDLQEFERVSRAFLFEQSDTGVRIDAIYRLEQLYRGDVFSGCRVDPYINAAQQRYRSILVDVMLEASRLFSREGNDTSAVWFARKAYDIDPAREDVYCTLMDMQDKAGQRTSALRTYFDCKRFLSDELGILPSQRTTALYQELILDRR